MFKKETIVYILRQISYRSQNLTRRDKLLLLLITFATGCMVVSLVALAVSGSALFAWLFEASRAAILIIFVVGFVWWIYDIAKHVE